MNCKNAALCSAKHTESISGLRIKQGKKGGKKWPENSWARHLSFWVSLRRLVLAHTEVTATASDTFWHLLLVAGFHGKHPRGSTTLTSDTNAPPSSLLQAPSKPPIQLLTAADHSCKKKKKKNSQKVNILSQTHADALLVCFPLKYWFLSHSRAIWSIECVLQTLTHTGTLIWHVLDQRETCVQTH